MRLTDQLAIRGPQSPLERDKVSNHVGQDQEAERRGVGLWDTALTLTGPGPARTPAAASAPKRGDQEVAGARGDVVQCGSCTVHQGATETAP